MIKIRRSDCPDVLKNSPSDGTRYNKAQVVKALWKMQHEKCCYCEQKIPQEGHLKTVEHFRPQSVFRGLKNDWKNLLLACAQCNGKKSDKFPIELTDDSGNPKVVYLKTDSNGNPLIIDPSVPDIDPEEHIDFIVDDKHEDYGIAFAKNDSDLGQTTIQVIGLYRSYYTRKRKYFYRRILLQYYMILLNAKEENDGLTLQIYKDHFKLLLSAREEFSAFARAFARHKRLQERFGVRIPVGAET